MPPIAEPLEEQVAAAMATRLRSITTGFDFWSTPVLVTRALLSIDQYVKELQTGPVLGVVRSSGSTIAQVSHPATFTHDLRLVVWGYVLGDATVLAATKLARLRADTLRCLLRDDTLGGLVRDLRPDPQGRMDTDNGVLEPQAWFAEDWLAVANEELLPS